MLEVKDKSPFRGGKEIEEINISSESVPESEKQNLSPGPEELLEDSALSEKAFLNMSQEFGLYVIGLNRIRSWAESIPEKIDKISSDFNQGNFEDIDEVLDEICDELLDPKEFREKLTRIALSVTHGT